MLNLIKVTFRYFRSFHQKEEGFQLTVETAFLLGLLVVFLAILVPALLSHLGGLAGRTDSTLDSYLQ